MAQVPVDRDGPVLTAFALSDPEFGRVDGQVYVRACNRQDFADRESGPPLDIHAQPGNRVRCEPDQRPDFVGLKKLRGSHGLPHTVTFRSGVSKPVGLDCVRTFAASPAEIGRSVKVQVLPNLLVPSARSIGGLRLKLT